MVLQLAFRGHDRSADFAGKPRMYLTIVRFQRIFAVKGYVTIVTVKLILCHLSRSFLIVHWLTSQKGRRYPQRCFTPENIITTGLKTHFRHCEEGVLCPTKQSHLRHRSKKSYMRLLRRQTPAARNDGARGF